MIYYDNKEFEDEIKYKVYLLNKYLTKHYGKEKAIALLKKNNSNLNKLAKALGKIDIAFFGEYYLTKFIVQNSDNPDIRPLSKTHYEIFEELNQIFVHNRNDKEEFILPRGMGKSLTINKLLSCWVHCYVKGRYTIVIGKTEKDSTDFIFDTKQMLNSKSIEESFGKLVDGKNRTVNKLELELTNNSKLSAFGAGTSVRGTTYGCLEGIFRPYLIICDDYINSNDILTDNAKEKVINSYYNEILEVGDKGSKFLMIGTPLAQDDLINTIKNDAEFRVFHRSVLKFDADDYFSENKYWQQYKRILLNSKNEDRLIDAENYYQENIDNMQYERLWNGKWSCTDLANKYFTKRLSFMQELMCDCDNVGDIWIKYMAKMKAEEIEGREFEKTVLTIDQGASNTHKSDYTAITILSKSNGFYLIREGQLYKFDSKTEFDKYIDSVIFMLKKWKQITHVFLEKNVYKGVDATRIEEKIAEDKELYTRGIIVETRYNTTNKDQRIMTITDKINSGQIIFNESNKEYNEQVFDFKGQKYSRNDDAIDSLEMAVNTIDTIQDTCKLKLLDRRLLF